MTRRKFFGLFAAIPLGVKAAAVHPPISIEALIRACFELKRARIDNTYRCVMPKQPTIIYQSEEFQQAFVATFFRSESIPQHLITDEISKV